MPPYQRISHSWVARYPGARGVVAFYGGEFFGRFPTFFYGYFLNCLYNAGYTLIVVPVQSGLDHARIAVLLLEERDAVRAALPELNRLPHFWVGHSVGGEIIALLEAWTDPTTNRFRPPGLPLSVEHCGVRDEMALLMAPDIADTAQAIPIPPLAWLLDWLGLGVKPTKPQMKRVISTQDLHTPTALISFHDDTVAGNESESPAVSDVAWFIQTYNAPHPELFLHQEMAGGHLEPIAFYIGRWVFQFSLRHCNITSDLPRPLEPLAIEYLRQLGGIVDVRRAERHEAQQGLA
jgi:hypothetical protein